MELSATSQARAGHWHAAQSHESAKPKALNKKYQQSGGRGNFCTPCNHLTYRVTAVIIFLVPNFFAHLVEKKIPMPTQLRKNFLRHP